MEPVVSKRPPVKIFSEFCSPTCSFGRIGSGKSVRVRWVMEYFYGEYKLIDIFDDGRLENVFMCFPNPYRKQYEALQEVNPNWEPQGYPTECFIPASPGIPDRIPTIFKPFKIVFSDLTREEFLILLGKLSIQEEVAMDVLWNLLVEKAKDLVHFPEFVAKSQDVLGDGFLKVGGRVKRIADDSTCFSLLLKLDRLNKLNILCEPTDPLALDLDTIMWDKKNVTCFSFAFMDSKNARHIIIGYLLRKIVSLRKAQRFGKYPPVVITHREIQKSAPARGKKSSYAFEGQSRSLEYLKEIVEEPRDIQVRLNADTQDPMKLDSDVRKGFVTKFLFSMDLAVLSSLTTHFYLDNKTFIGIQKLGIGECAIKTLPDPHDPDNRIGVQFPVLAMPTKSWCKSPGDQFFQVWKKHGGEFYNPKKELKLAGPKDVISIKTISREESEEVNLRIESLYDHYGDVVRFIAKSKEAGLKLKDLKEDPLIKGLGWGEMKIIRVLNRLVSEKKLRKDIKSKSYFYLEPPAPGQAKDPVGEEALPQDSGPGLE